MMSGRVEYHASRVVLYPGDCLQALDGLPENSVDSVCVDPPYHLTSIVKRFGKTSRDDATDTSARARAGADGMARLSRGFMGKEWDGGDIAFDPETWAKVLRALKPGGHMLAFAASKNAHRMICAIEDAGFEIRDCLQWLYGTGFPKSLNIGDGFGTALKPAYEPICLARKPLSEGTVAANVLRWGTGALNIDGCRIGDGVLRSTGNGFRERDDGYGMQGGVMGGSELGRWPANICHDGSDEVVAAFPDSDGQNGLVNGQTSGNMVYGARGARPLAVPRNDTGSAARFFYSSKADKNDRIGSKHPTVKPVDLIQWCIRLITPKGGTVLDCFAGSGTCGEAALREGMKAVLMEREPEYIADIGRRMELAFLGPDGKSHAILKARNLVDDAGPLFASEAAE